LWAATRATDVAVAPSSNPMILERARKSAARVVSFGLAPSDDYRLSGDDLVGPQGPFGKVSAMRRALPHDVTNALAASAAVLESGVATVAGVTQALAEFTPSHHRIEFVAEVDGVGWYDDSKATSPHAAGTALRAFPSIVYIAGGRNKGLDLAQLLEHAGNVKSTVSVRSRSPRPCRKPSRWHGIAQPQGTWCCCLPHVPASTGTATTKSVAAISRSAFDDS
jgi:UDP-N-acetylmuramoylalanine--D-glutamate ligase